MDDHRAARAASAHQELAARLVEHQRGRHGRTRPFARLHAVGHRPALGVGGREAEVGQFVVQQEALDHLARAEDVLDGGGHGQGIALRIDDADVAGAVFGLGCHRRVARLDGARVAGLGDLHRWRARRLADQFRPSGEVGRVEQAHPAAGGWLHEIGVAQVQGAVGEGQPGRLGVQVEPVG